MYIIYIYIYICWFFYVMIAEIDMPSASDDNNSLVSSTRFKAPTINFLTHDLSSIGMAVTSPPPQLPPPPHRHRLPAPRPVPAPPPLEPGYAFEDGWWR